jgi:hypothetical protein
MELAAATGSSATMPSTYSARASSAPSQPGPTYKAPAPLPAIASGSRCSRVNDVPPPAAVSRTSTTLSGAPKVTRR